MAPKKGKKVVQKRKPVGGKARSLTHKEAIDICKHIQDHTYNANIMSQLLACHQFVVFPERKIFLSNPATFDRVVAMCRDTYTSSYLAAFKERGDCRYATLQTKYYEGVVSEAVQAAFGLHPANREEGVLVLSTLADLLFEDCCQVGYEAVATQCSKCVVNQQLQPPESDYALLTISGGCVGQLLKVLRRKMSGKVRTSDTQKELARDTDRVLRAFCMSKTEKALNLPPAVESRDRGSLFILKTEFWSWIRELDRTICQSANEAGYCQYGAGLIKVTRAQLVHNKHLISLFETAAKNTAKAVHMDVLKATSNFIYTEVTRKFCNARLNEFLQSRAMRLADGSMKGGQSLRDKLFGYA